MLLEAVEAFTAEELAFIGQRPKEGTVAAEPAKYVRKPGYESNYGYPALSPEERA